MDKKGIVLNDITSIKMNVTDLTPKTKVYSSKYNEESKYNIQSLDLESSKIDNTSLVTDITTEVDETKLNVTEVNKSGVLMDWKDVILINGETYKIAELEYEEFGVQYYVLYNKNNEFYRFNWYRSDYPNFKILKDALDFCSGNLTVSKIGFVPTSIIKTSKGLGYLLPMLSNYSSFKSIITNKAKFKSLDILVTTAINLIGIFDKLEGLNVYPYSIIPEKLLIDTKTGDVFFDIVSAVTLEHTGLKLQNYEYNAPETNEYQVIVKESTRHTLMVLLFQLLYHDHPLEGYKVINDMSLTNSQKWYGSEAIFNMSSINKSNGIVRGIHYQLKSLWDKYPRFIKSIFIDYFENKLFNLTKRDTPDNLTLAFKHVRNMIAVCSCGSVSFIQNIGFNGKSFNCTHCGSSINFVYFKETKKVLPYKDGTVLYLSYLTRDIQNDKIIGEIKEIDNQLYIHSYSRETWRCYSNGVKHVLTFEEDIPIENDLEIETTKSKILFNSIGV